MKKYKLKNGEYIGKYPLDCANDEWCTITGDIYKS